MIYFLIGFILAIAEIMYALWTVKQNIKKETTIEDIQKEIQDKINLLMSLSIIFLWPLFLVALAVVGIIEQFAKRFGKDKVDNFFSFFKLSNKGLAKKFKSDWKDNHPEHYL